MTLKLLTNNINPTNSIGLCPIDIEIHSHEHFPSYFDLM